MAQRRSRKGGARSAAGLDRTLAGVKSRLEGWRSERRALVTELENVVRTGQRMLEELGASPVEGGRPGRSTGRQAKTGSRRLSPEGRARIIAAAKKRWAKYNREKKKKGA